MNLFLPYIHTTKGNRSVLTHLTQCSEGITVRFGCSSLSSSSTWTSYTWPSCCLLAMLHALSTARDLPGMVQALLNRILGLSSVSIEVINSSFICTLNVACCFHHNIPLMHYCSRNLPKLVVSACYSTQSPYW